jgi:tetratricopeptide (TPR) repeat protein
MVSNKIIVEHPASSPGPSMNGSVTHAILLVVVVLTACVAFAQTHTTVRHYKERIDDTPPEIAQAEDAIQKNDFTGAETLLRKAIDKDPNNHQAWSYQAWFDVFESNLNLGLMLVRANNPEAEQFLRAATTLKPTDHIEEGQARAWLALAHVLENKKPEEALQAYRKASELTPKDPEPHLSAGLLHERQKEFSDAEAEYKQVLALDPHNADPHNTEAAIGLTNLYMKSGRLGDAEPLLRRLTAERPDDAGIHLQLGRVLAAQGKKDDAITEIQTALKLAPADSDAQRDLAELLVESKKLPDAEQMYRDLIKGHPNDAELHQLLGEVLLKEHKFPDAQQEFIATVKIKPDLGDAYGSLAKAANENQNYALTIKALEVRAKLLPETPASYFLRATALDHLRDYKQAAQYYHLFLDAANGKYPDDEWKARHRLIWIESKKR